MKELNIDDLNNQKQLVDYYDGDVAIIDNITNLTNVAPIYSKMNFIILCSKGRIQFNINDTPLMLEEQEILLSAPYVILDNYLFSPDFECKILCLSDDIIHAMLGEMANSWNISVHNRRTNVIQLPEEDQEQFIYYYELIKFKMNHQERKNSTIVMQAIIQALLFDVLSLIDMSEPDPAKVTPSHGKTLFNDFLRILAASKIKHSPVDMYAEMLNITPKYLTMLCSKYSGRPASEWIAQYTKEDIRYNLLHTSQSIKQIAARLGFPNVSFFWKLCTPSLRNVTNTIKEPRKHGRLCHKPLISMSHVPVKVVILRILGAARLLSVQPTSLHCPSSYTVCQ